MISIRLWHNDIIPYLPKSQLIAQWRELNSIYKNQDNHILINYIYEYPKHWLLSYSNVVIAEMNKRCYKINKWDNFNSYFSDVLDDYCRYNMSSLRLKFLEHNNRYLLQNYMNLQEKVDRGQQDFSQAQYEKLELFIKENRGLNV